MSRAKNAAAELNLSSFGRKPSAWEALSSEKYFKWVLVIPLILVLLVFMFYPLIYCIYNSFREGDISGTVFVALKNYQKMMHDKTFWIPFNRTVRVTVI